MSVVKEIKVKMCSLCEKLLDHSVNVGEENLFGTKVLSLMEIMECNDKACLMVFYGVVHEHPVKTAKRLFPTRPRGYVTATVDLSHYACNKAVGINERLKGNIQTAEIYEKICENIYKNLPQYARW